LAKIALLLGFAAAGALTGGLAWAGYLGFGIAGSAAGAIGLGTAVGVSVGKPSEDFFPKRSKRLADEEGEA
jgi:hypothetical protein